jgi:Ca2+-binding RTX toxin-like protein
MCAFCGGYHESLVADPNGPSSSTSSDFVVTIASVSSTSPAPLPSFEAQTLILGGTNVWNSPAPAGTPMFVTYSFMSLIPAYETLYYTPSSGLTFQTFDGTQQNAARQALAAWSNVSGVTFVEVPDAVGGDIRFGMHTMTTSVGGYAFYPNTNGNTVLDAGGDIFLNNYYLGADPLSFGTYGFFALLHEIGHALGLKHPFDGSPTLPSWLDNTNNTVMSYTVTGYPNQPQNYDVQAIQYLYGSRAAANSDGIATYWDGSALRLGTVGSASGETLIGINLADLIYGQGGNDTIYGRAGNDMLDGGSGVDGLWGGAGADRYMLTGDGDTINGEIYGDGDIDIVDYSLASGGVSAGFGQGFLIAGGPWDSYGGIEELWGSNFADQLNGSSSNSIIRGGAGNDVISCADGDDLLDGGSGADTMSGGLGRNIYVVDDVGDVIISSSSYDSVQSYVSWTLPVAGAALTLLGSAYLGVGNIVANTITGNNVANLLRGLEGNDTLFGYGGNDTLTGGADSDELRGGAGSDWIEGETGNDPFAGSAGNDTIYGEDGDDVVLAGDGNDHLSGGNGTDALVGEGGNDIIYGDGDFDLMDGRAGTDEMHGGTGGDIIFGDAGVDVIYGDAGDDMIMGERGENTNVGDNDTIWGGIGNDMLDGSAGDDIILGEEGNDIIDGDFGNDLIVGGPGSEIIAGSAYNGVTGQDQYIYLAMSDGGDSIYGFRTTAGNNDQINLVVLFNNLGYTGTNPRGDGYLSVQESGGNTYVYADGNGPAGGGNWTHLVTLVGTSLSAGGLPSVDDYFFYQ